MLPNAAISSFACAVVSLRGIEKREQIFDQLMIEPSLLAAVKQPLPEARAMVAQVVGWGS
jgi:hypothetical protein